MQKVEGVETAKVNLKDGLTVLELRPNNAVTLERLRTIIRDNGFVSREAEIVAKGTVRGTTFAVSGTGERLPVARAPVASGDRWQFSSAVKR